MVSTSKAVVSLVVSTVGCSKYQSMVNNAKAKQSLFAVRLLCDDGSVGKVSAACRDHIKQISSRHGHIVANDETLGFLVARLCFDVFHNGGGVLEYEPSRLSSSSCEYIVHSLRYV